MGLNLIGCVIVATLLINGAAAVIHTVGSETGWAVPSEASVYSTWATDEKEFYRDDQLQFRWSGTHNVANATKEEYDNCAKTANVITTNSGDIINFTSSGPQYFICTIGDHCQRGQKLAVNVTAGSNPATPQLSPPPPSSTAPALASVATSSALYAISTIITSILIYI